MTDAEWLDEVERKCDWDETSYWGEAISRLIALARRTVAAEAERDTAMDAGLDLTERLFQEGKKLEAAEAEVARLRGAIEQAMQLLLEYKPPGDFSGWPEVSKAAQPYLVLSHALAWLEASHEASDRRENK